MTGLRNEDESIDMLGKGRLKICKAVNQKDEMQRAYGRLILGGAPRISASIYSLTLKGNWDEKKLEREGIWVLTMS